MRKHRRRDVGRDGGGGAVGGIPDIVEDGATGFLTAGPDDAPGFVDAIEALIASRERRREIIRTAHGFAVPRATR